MNPITREEQFMAYAAGQGQLNLTPITRKEMFLAKAGGQSVETPTPITREEMFLSQISGGSGGGGGSSGGGTSSVAEKDVNFYDYDGTLLHSYTVEEAQALTELPPLPTQQGLICQGWNYDLETIKDYNSPLDVGALYITDDGKTRIYIKIPLDNYKFSIRFTQAKQNQAVFDWGDGTETSSSTNTTSCVVAHTYAKAGDYVIAIENTDKNNVVDLGATNNYSAFGGTAPASSYASIANNALVEKIECGFEFAAHAYAFAFCTSLKTITIPNPLREFYTVIMGQAFYQCYSLKHITFPKGTSQVNSYAFHGCYNLKSVSCPNQMAFGQGSFAYCQRLPRFVLPKASTIGQGVFAHCVSLKDIYASEIGTIAQSIISQNNSLEKFTIPEGCTKISNQAFNYSLISKITIPSSVETFGTGVFSSCYSLEEVEGYTKSQFVQKETFSGCYSLKNITIPEGTTEIPQAFLQNCYSLESVTMPSSVAIVRPYALSSCARLLSVVFLGNVTLIESSAFYNCQGVRYYDFTHCTAVPTLSATSAFSGIPADCEIRVPAALYDEWIAATNWSSFASKIVAV